MKFTLLATAFLAVAPLAAAQQAPPKIESPSQDAVAEKQAQAQEERTRAVQRADEAVRRAGQQNQNQQGGGFGGGGLMRPAPMRINVKPVKGAWLGLTTSAPPAALRHQLKLPDGTALVVDFVQPKSPADQAGIKQYDLLTKLNDQLLVNSEQLAVLVRTFKPNEEIKLTYFREGEQHTQSVTLVERELPPLEDIQFQFLNGNGDFRPATLPPVRPMPFGGNPGNGAAGGGGGFGGGGARAGENRFQNYYDDREHSLTWLDGRQQVTVNLSGDPKTVTITDNRTKKVIYQGPIDDLEKNKSLPGEARGAVERVRLFLKSNPNIDAAVAPETHP